MTKPATSALEILERSRKILDDPERWVRGDWAYFREDTQTLCFCVEGAMIAGADDYENDKQAVTWLHHNTHPQTRGMFEIYSAAQQAFVDSADKLYRRSEHDPDYSWDAPWQFNDHRGRQHAEVLAVLDDAIKTLKEA